jgi:DNA-binding GntR family transcriptional regulator
VPKTATPAGRPGAIGALSPVVRPRPRERISDRVHDELSAAIRDLRLPPGALLSETELARQLGVSRTPLREAISRLDHQGLVHVTAQVGTRVALIDLKEVEEASFIRCALEVSAFRRACELQAPVGRLRRILERQEKAIADADANRFFDTDEQLHQEIFRLSGFPNAWKVVFSAKLQMDRVRRLVIPDAIRNRGLIDEHIGIVDLLEARDQARGAALVTAHAQHVLSLAPRLQKSMPEYFAH